MRTEFVKNQLERWSAQIENNNKKKKSAALLQHLQLLLVLRLTEGVLQFLFSLRLPVDVFADGLETFWDGLRLAVLQEGEGGQLKLGLLDLFIQIEHL